MGNTPHWGLSVQPFRLVFICIFLVMTAHECAGGGNLTIVAACSEQERLVLLKFKLGIIDNHGVLSSWVGDDCCRWERVGCDDATGRVVSLDLGNYILDEDDDSLDDQHSLRFRHPNSIPIPSKNYMLSGEVNSCLAELVNLEHLDVAGNYFPSQIPQFFGSFKQLRYLNLSHAGFYGSIPHQIGNLSNLEVLDLSRSPYSKELMIDDVAWILGLAKLKHLELSRVDLSIPQNLDNLLYMIPSLLSLGMSGCRLSMANLGSHHHNSSRELSSIKHLDLSDNNLWSPPPTFFLNMTSLEFLDLSDGILFDTRVSFPLSFENLVNMIPSVSELRLSNCLIKNDNLSPTSLNMSTFSNIQHLDLSHNRIQGRIPYVLTNISSLLSLDLSWNMLNSSIPSMPNLLQLDISYNDFREIEDVGVWRHCHLKELSVTHNLLKGEIIGPSTNISKCSQNFIEILYLDDNQLTGPISETLKRLRSLQSLDLSKNQLNGPIPESFGRLTALTNMNLESNRFTGPISEALGRLRSLRRLNLSYNQLNGFIPESLGRLTALTNMYLESNRFTGPIPLSLGSLTSLRMLSVSSNLLNGTIPISVGKLTRLQLLDISHNSLQGVIQESHFANLSMLKHLVAAFNAKLICNFSREWTPPFQLKTLSLGSCKIEDEFPQWVRTQRKLEVLELSNTSIFGSLPTWLGVMHVLDLSHNKLTGPLKNLPFGGMLSLQDNLFKGLIPRWFCTLRNLTILDLSKNRFTGKIPECLWNMPYLYVMLLGSNRLSGLIPRLSGPMYSSLLILQLNDNNLNGELPQDVGRYKNLNILDLGENKISGNIPSWIGTNMTNLSGLRLHKNNFTGRIPHSLCKSKRLQILDIAYNNFAGSIPRCFGEINGMTKRLFQPPFMYPSKYGNMIQVLKGVEFEYTKTLQFVTNMDLSSNNLVGDVPEALMKLNALVGLNLSNNHFTGGIPKSIGSMKSLNSLDLSKNELTGRIPPSMAALTFLSYLNLSHNNLSGQIPTGNQLQTLTDPSIYADNPYLCGAPLPKECAPRENTRMKNKRENSNEPVLFYLDIISGFATGFWGIIGVLLFKKQWIHKLFMFCKETMDKIYIVVTIRVLKMRRSFKWAS